MSAESDKDRPGQPGLPDALRSAVEKTFAATAEPRGRAQDLFRRGGDDAREASASAAARVADAADKLRVAGREEVRRLEARTDQLEQQVNRLAERVNQLESKSEVEG